MNQNGTTKKLIIFYLAGMVLVITGVVLYNSRNDFTLSQAQKSKDTFAAIPNIEKRTFSASQAVNQNGNKLEPTGTSVWIGTADDLNQSYLALQFKDVSLPDNAKITSASLQITAIDSPASKNSLNLKISAEKGFSLQPFLPSALPSSRLLTTSSMSYTDSYKWLAATNYKINMLETVIREVYDKDTEHTLNLIIQGMSNLKNQRKYIYSVGTNFPPQLVLEYTAQL